MLHLFPVRHHSPRATAVLGRLLDRLRPELILVEGPEDATPLIEALTDADAEPPLAILAWRRDDPATALWPFAAYSPEYAALRWARAHRVPARFVDLPSGAALLGPQRLDEPGEAGLDPFGDLARLRGHRSFEELWEAEFEAPDFGPERFSELLVAWADLVRAAPDPRRRWHRARDAWMRRRAEGEGVRLLVAGAAHVAALAAGEVDDALIDEIPAPGETGLGLVPFSFTRLAEQTGYGAGNRAPRFYQRAHEAGCDYGRATLEMFVEFGGQLRLRGHSASLADVLEAWRLARALTELRGKSEPGLDELREAAVATLCRGDPAFVDQLLWPTVVGQSVGRVPARVGRNALQDEFWREVEARRLPRSDAEERFSLQLIEPVQVATSVFLHRLRVCEVPYAICVGASAGGSEALQRAREQWEARWTPATDVALVTAIVHGDRLVEVAARKLGQRLRAAGGAGAAAEVLLEAVVCDCPALAAEALRACEFRGAADDDVLSLARAARVLADLVRFGSSRVAAGATLTGLRDHLFTRARLRVAGACVGNDEAVAPARAALRTLQEVAAVVDREAWLATLAQLADDGLVHPGCAGLAAGLAWLAGALDEAGLAAKVAFRLSGDPREGAGFLEGALEVNPLVLCRSRPVVAELDRFLAGLDRERFPELLPVLRRAFSTVGATERRYLLENVLQLRKVEDLLAAKVVVEAPVGELDGLLDDLDELL